MHPTFLWIIVNVQGKFMYFDLCCILNLIISRGSFLRYSLQIKTNTIVLDFESQNMGKFPRVSEFLFQTVHEKLDVINQVQIWVNSRVKMNFISCCQQNQIFLHLAQSVGLSLPFTSFLLVND